MNTLIFQNYQKIRQIIMQIQPLKTRVKNQPFNISNRLVPNNPQAHSLNSTAGTRIQCQQISKREMASLNSQKSHHNFTVKQPDTISQTTQSVLDQCLQIKSNTSNTIRNSESVPSRTYFASNSAVFTRGQLVDSSQTSTTKSNIYTASNNMGKNSQIISNKTSDFYRPTCRTSYLDLSNCQNSNSQSYNGVNADNKYKIQTDRDNVKLTCFRLNGDSFKKQQFRQYEKCSTQKQKKKGVQTETDKKQQGEQHIIKRVNSKKTLFLNSSISTNGYLNSVNSNCNGMNSISSPNIKNTQSNPTLLNSTNDKVSKLNEVIQNKVVVQKLEERKLKKQKSNKNISSQDTYQKPYVCHNASSYNNLISSYISENVNKNLASFSSMSDIEKIKKSHKEQIERKEAQIERLRKEVNELRNEKELLEIRIKQYHYETGNLKRYLQQKKESEKKLKNELRQTISHYQNTICSINQKNKQNELKNISIIKSQLDNYRNANRQLETKLQQEFSRYFQLNSKFLFGQRKHKQMEALLQQKSCKYIELEQKHKQYELKYKEEGNKHRELLRKYKEVEETAKKQEEKLNTYFNEVSNIFLYLQGNFKQTSSKLQLSFQSQNMKLKVQNQDIQSPSQPISPISQNDSNECKLVTQQTQQENVQRAQEKDIQKLLTMIISKLKEIKERQTLDIKQVQQKQEQYQKQIGKLKQMKQELSINYQKLKSQKTRIEQNCSESIVKSEGELFMKLEQLKEQQKKRAEIELVLQMYSDMVDATNEVVTRTNARLLNFKYQRMKQSQEVPLDNLF